MNQSTKEGPKQGYLFLLYDPINEKKRKILLEPEVREYFREYIILGYYLGYYLRIICIAYQVFQKLMFPIRAAFLTAFFSAEKLARSDSCIQQQDPIIHYCKRSLYSSPSYAFLEGLCFN